MKKIKQIIFLFIIIISLYSFTSCELVYDQSPGRLILIGVGLDYMDINGEGNNPLPNPTNDIREVAFALSSLSSRSSKEFLFIPMIQQHGLSTPIPDHNYPNETNINMLFNELIDGDNISAKVYDGAFNNTYTLTSGYETFGSVYSPTLIDPINKNDIVIFYFSGHGQDYNGDLRLPKLKDEQDRESYSLDTLFSSVDNFESTSLVILDSCYSGTLIQESSSSINTVTTSFVDRFPSLYKKFFSNNGGIAEPFSILASAKSDQLSWPTESSLHINSLFTYNFLKSLGYVIDTEIGTMSDDIPAKNKGKIDIDSIYKYINGNISRQQPVISGGRNSLVLFDW